MGPPLEASPADRPNRLVSLDAYRGFIMLAMVSAGFGLARVAEHFPGNALWKFLAYHTGHVEWIGCSFWDLIQPSFMFMVGVALPYSYAARRRQGDSYLRILAHVVYRSAVLILLGIFLQSNGSEYSRTNFTFVNVLTQIGLGYTFVFLLVGKRPAVQFLAVVAILAGYWLLFVTHPLEGGGPFSGWFGHWNKNANFAAAADRVFLNWFPRPEPFRLNEGGYQTLNFVPSMATMIFGLMASEMLRGQRSAGDKCLRLALAAVLCLGAGMVLDQTVCPSVKRIWTPSWAVFSAGWTFGMLAGFFWVIDVKGYRAWALPLVVVGMNSIAAYCMSMMLRPWVGKTLQTHLGPGIFEGVYGPVWKSAAVLAFVWLVCWWMYRRRLFLRV